MIDSRLYYEGNDDDDVDDKNRKRSSLLSSSLFSTPCSPIMIAQKRALSKAANTLNPTVQQ